MRRALVWLAAVGLTLTVAACSSGGDAAGPSSTTSTPRPELPETTSTTIDATEADVLEAYLGYWDAYAAANDPPDMFHPDLKAFATGTAYETVFESTQANKALGRALRRPAESIGEHRAEVVSVDGERAVVRDCSIDDGLVVDIASGEVLNDDVATQLFESTLVVEDGRWKVSDNVLQQRWEGVAGCAQE